MGVFVSSVDRANRLNSVYVCLVFFLLLCVCVCVRFQAAGYTPFGIYSLVYGPGLPVKSHNSDSPTLLPATFSSLYRQKGSAVSLVERGDEQCIHLFDLKIQSTERIELQRAASK